MRRWDQSLVSSTRQASKRLRSALALTLGAEAIISLKDVVGLDDDDEIVAHSPMDR